MLAKLKFDTSTQAGRLKNHRLNPQNRTALIYLCVAVLWPAHAADNKESLLVSAEWLNTHLHTPGLLIIDTRANTDYQQGHIPGAINIPADTTFASTGETFRVGGLQHIQQLFSHNGVGQEDDIIVYDDGNHTDAARVFWVLEVYRHQHVRLLNGGMAVWHDNQFPVETTPNMRASTTYIPSIDHHRITSRKAMQIALNNPGVSIIDSRTEKEYAGIESRAERKGHIPGAISIPWTANMMEQHHDLKVLLNDSDLARQYQAHKDKQVITYCNRGKQSALTYFVLRQIGFNVSVYDGAWLEWGNDPSLPIE